ncbi:hypothetical protein [Desulfosediminicola sp.]|uniref:hypothetical protein n=1 Tax=Desulfosediminicola sp. TaxID=2886825 RepID=UPI003AF2D41F
MENKTLGPPNAEHSGDLGTATKEPWKGRPAATGRVLLRPVMFLMPTGTHLKYLGQNPGDTLSSMAHKGLFTRNELKNEQHETGTGTPLRNSDLPEVFARLEWTENGRLPGPFKQNAGTGVRVHALLTGYLTAI